MGHTWHASMIAPVPGLGAAPRLRGEVALADGHGEVAAARLLVTAHGVVEAYVGTSRASEEVLTPGWSAYEWRLRHRDHDVTAAVVAAQRAGEPVVLGLVVGNGWFHGRLGFMRNQAVYGDEVAGFAQLEVTFADGHTQVAGTDESWTCTGSEVLADDLYDGQTIDARLRDDSWLRPGGGSGRPVHAVSFDTGTLAPYVGPPVVRHESLGPTRIWTSPAGRTLVDFGQNLTGWVRLRARGESGTTVTVRHAEVLENDELGTRPLRTAKATDRFVLSGGDDVFEPTFTFHGFRYAEVEGYPGGLTADAIEAVVVHSAMDRTGTFECSDPLLNQLHHNVVWSQRGNFLDLPTDCPQRDERLGWTGDIAVFTPTAAFLYDVAGFLGDWLVDLDLEQRAAGGVVPFVVPDNIKYDPPLDWFPQTATTAIWSDAAVWVPWALWRAYGDAAALERAYPAMLAHSRAVQALLDGDGLWTGGFQFGDWLDPTAPPEAPFEAKADNDVVATACAVRTFREAAAAARVLGREDEAAELEALHEATRAAFVEHYVAADGTIRSDCPTVYALAIAFDVVDGAARDAAGDRLAALAEQNGYRVATGFAGTPYVLDALTATGHVTEAYRLLTEQGCPSWLYPVTMGATTIWERWDSMLEDGSINPGEMTSFDHYALGSVADWMHRTVAGLSPLEPGYARARFAPIPGGGLTWASASLRTGHGTVSVSWRLEADSLQAEAVVPEGVHLEVELAGDRSVVGAGRYVWAVAL
ncbi:glycoside hydrolase family 78 protein [Actinotalea sp. M2MS4P-6]|uniref:alpha-L-rhamnosidase n=1 Tax=Actinotalea sp. M2MS4P-6 TaxID=2983762 RepID=UPI0021E3AE27|nr:alpha-L-rhamnosidase [Actinotalea sp. M2MS4P-6]MCV2394196.1 glycoside hydrolase family 78 protein [Actinotalea sp. M2MS4P-6]